MPQFANGYLEALFFTECHSDNPELEDASINDMSQEAWEACLRDCKAFEDANAADLEAAYAVAGYDEHRAGVDFWLTRNGHGAGFWDRDLGEVGERLSAACKAFRAVDVYRGDDGKVYLS